MAEPAPERDNFKATEVCKEANVAPYVLRYWVTEFPCLAADKDKSVNRAFTSRELRIITRIRELLYDEGFTIAGAKKRIDTEISGGAFDAPPGKAAKPKPAADGAPFLSPVAPPAAAPAAPKATPKPVVVKTKSPVDVVRELKAVLALLGPGRK